MLGAGDPAGIALAIRALPRDLAKGFCRSVRDERLRQAASMLRAAMPRASEHAIAVHLAGGGLQLERGGSLARLHEFGGLDVAELTALKREICAALVWCRPRHDDRRWPKLRQILNLM